MTFRAVLSHVLTACRLNTAFYAETVAYTPNGGTATTLTIHPRYRRREIRDPRTGDARTVEELKVEIAKTDLPAGPQGGDRLVRSGETRGYMYAYAGGDTPVSWKATFHREIVTGQRGRQVTR